MLDGRLVCSRGLALVVMRDPETYTVDDPRFSTGQVVGPSMLTRDGAEHEAEASITRLLDLPGLQLDPAHPAAPRGLVFRKPPTLHVLWTADTI